MIVNGRPELESVLAWREHPDSDKVVRWGRMTPYHEGGGGISLGFNNAENCRELHHELTSTSGKKKHPFRINRSAFTSVHKKAMAAQDALRIGDDPTILHIESIGRGALRKLNGAIEALFGESLPKAILERIMERLPKEEQKVWASVEGTQPIGRNGEPEGRDR